MSILQINEGVTDHNRKQSRRICELKGWEYLQYSNSPYERDKMAFHQNASGIPSAVELPNGSFTLCWVVGMLEKKNLEWVSMKALCDECGYYGSSGWFNKEQELIGEAENPHDLTAAMDALIALEEKKGENR